jgi:formamidopyrimidine-DNA glycosylase
MDQSLVAGIGNIYATEALFAAGLRPARTGASVTLAQTRLLCSAVKSILKKAVALGGSTLSDSAYLDLQGRPGRAQQRLKVYGRGIGACGHTLKATPRPIAGRTSLYCPRCQS